MNIESYLKKAEHYALEMERLHLKEMQERLSYLPENEVEKLSILLKRKRAFSKELAKSVGEGTWTFKPLVRKETSVKGKKRTIFHAQTIEDLICYQTISRGLESALQPFLSPSLYSFQKNKHFFQAIKNLTLFLLQHRAEVTAPKSRGLYLFKVDVHSYYDSIPTDEHSPLWGRLSAALGIGSGPLFNLLKEAVSPCREGWVKGKGVPIGHPLSCPIANFYLSELDHELSGTSHSFYARYCDDLVFASPSHQVVNEAMQKLRGRLAAAGLNLNPKKTQLLFWNGAGRASEVEGFEGKEAFTLLGYRLHFNGTVALPPAKTKRILKELSKRFRLTAALMKESQPEEKQRALCQTAAHAFSIISPLALQGTRSLLRITNRAQIKQLRYLTALKMATALTRVQGVRAFRTIRPSSLIKGGLLRWKK